MKSTMSWDEVKSVWSAPVQGNYKPRKATQKGFAHKHNPTWKPAKADMSPKEWHKTNRKKMQSKKA